MASTHTGARSASHLNLFKRCVVCPNDAPACPNCPQDQMCSQTVQSCDYCASTTCVPINVPDSSNQGGGPNVGAIAGGVIGGVVFIAGLLFLFWWFVVRPRREQTEDEWEEDVAENEKRQAEFAMSRDGRSSMHTVASTTSTAMTRASNVIQIAYIPGVTNRSGFGSPDPDLLVPPVPPIPASTASGATSYISAHQDQHFFHPGDLRDSTFSGFSDGSYARTSIAPSLAQSLDRRSVATTIYRENAVVSPMPAQTIVRGKAAVVSVKSYGSNSPEATPSIETPPVPLIDYQTHQQGAPRVQIPHSTDGARPSPPGSVKSNITPGTSLKPLALNIIKGKVKAPTAGPSSTRLDTQGLNNLPSRSSPLSSEASPSTPANEGSSLLNSRLRPLTEVSVTDSFDTAPVHARAHRISANDLASDTESEDEDPHARARRSLLLNSHEHVQGPSKLSGQSKHAGPFGDEHAVDGE